MPQEDPSRTETATDKRRNKARQDGNVPKGQEVGKTLTVLAGIVGLWFWVGYISREMVKIFAWFMRETPFFNVNQESVYSLFMMTSQRIAVMVLPVIFFIALVAIVTMRAQVGPLWTTKVFQPKFGKFLNPIGGLKKFVLSTKTLINLAKTIGMAGAIAITLYVVIKDEMDEMLPLFYQPPEALAVFMLKLGAKIIIWALVPMLLIAVADLIYSRWDYEEQLKMTKDEVKDERKQAEGDPKVKAQQRQKMMEVSMRRMLEDVPKADVVVTNPTHYAVALRYDPLESPAPQVLAKGLDHMAEKIKAIARENNVPIRENKALAQALYKSVEVGDSIPEELYQAVASLLAQLQKFRGRRPQ
jgi:flagellar biosynthetic protein FlhB